MGNRVVDAITAAGCGCFYGEYDYSCVGILYELGISDGWVFRQYDMYFKPDIRVGGGWYGPNHDPDSRNHRVLSVLLFGVIMEEIMSEREKYLIQEIKELKEKHPFCTPDYNNCPVCVQLKTLQMELETIGK